MIGTASDLFARVRRLTLIAVRKPSYKVLGSSVRLLITLAMVFVLDVTVNAAIYTSYTDPTYLFNDGYIPTPYQTSFGAAWSDVQNDTNGCRGGVCYSVYDVVPTTTGSYGPRAASSV